MMGTSELNIPSCHREAGLQGECLTRPAERQFNEQARVYSAYRLSKELRQLHNSRETSMAGKLVSL